MYQRFDTFPFNDTGKSEQDSVEALVDGSITDLKYYCVFDLALKNNIEFTRFKE